MYEYWTSSRQACLELLKEDSLAVALPDSVPEAFRQLRPWVHHGWEMVLLAAEFIRSDSCLLRLGATVFSRNYSQHCKEALAAWNWYPDQLQEALEHVRAQAIAYDRSNWLAKHKAFPGVVQRLNQLPKEGYELAVLTTKGKEFTAELLNHFQIKPNLLYGHEAGSKPNVLIELSKTRHLQAFIEDRLNTLETVLKQAELSELSCYLATWGYLKPEDQQSLPSNIHLLDTKTFMGPVSRWS